MKKLFLLLLLIPLVSFGQDEVTVIQSKTSVSSSTNIENELVLSDEKTTIKTPLTADLSNYTHLLLVDILIHSYSEYFYGNNGVGTLVYQAGAYKEVKNYLGLSAFTVMNPYEVDKKRFKKNLTFLKTIKNESYLYLYLRQGKGRGDDRNTTFIIRDWKNKIIYNATHINTGLNEILAPLIDY
tara:strand:+ start:2557 stop:3105 length:549 start_codon:yes stop_codon:yes gene_type:complete